MRCEDVTAVRWFRGLKNLEASCEVERVVTFCIVQKVTKKHAGRSPATHDSKLCRKWVCKNFRRLLPKPVLPAQRRRKGFESVRKGDCTADARLIFFEKELLYYKLTVGCRRWNLQLRVSFVAVRNWNFCMLKNAFLYRVTLHELKNCSFPQNKSFPFTESFTYFAQSRFLTHKNFFCSYLSSLSAKISNFHKPKVFLSYKPFLIPTKSNPFSPSTAHSNHP